MIDGIKKETQSNGSFNINSNSSNIDETKKEKEIEIEKAKKIIQKIDQKKELFIEIIQKYIDDNCVEFKKEDMRSKFTNEFKNLAEKMTEKYTIEKKEKSGENKEGKICSFDNDFSNGTQNLDNYSKNVSQINSNKSDITNPSL